MTSLQFRCLFTVIRTAGLTQPRFELGWHFPSEALTRSLSHFTAQRNGGAGVNQHRRCSSKRSGITGGFCPPDMEGLWKGECSAWAAPPELGGLLLSTHVDGEDLLKTQSAFYSPTEAGVGEIIGSAFLTRTDPAQLCPRTRICSCPARALRLAGIRAGFRGQSRAQGERSCCLNRPGGTAEVAPPGAAPAATHCWVPRWFH